ncbi:murein transglycosylase A [Pseudovibrio sp. SPO723]|uniref:murein transglycosylase A n=1 Tax=Nesiotobacter zosterae TaxID=392721 RepID=UPI0029C3D341|nr:MltA domain-containing protein [Pseudovibrio sp. SPO723]MDX5595086.1 MltA domain-containing protein [Pseudovibrio sp. SPO723]
MQPIEFSEIYGWAADDHSAALHAFARSCHRPATKARGKEGELIAELCKKARALVPATNRQARKFFEENFIALRANEAGFVTGYYEPVLQGSLKKTKDYAWPLHGLPKDRRNLPDRAAVMDGALDGKNLEVLWVKDPVDAFFTAIQGSARVETEDGRTYRLRFAGKSGHPYTPVGRLLIERGQVAREDMSMQAIRDWMGANPKGALELMRENRSYIFFTLEEENNREDGPIGAAGVPLVAERSLAIDPRFHEYGLPIFIGTRLPDARGAVKPFNRLMVAHDTGSAILGSARGDIFFGSGPAAGDKAGRTRHKADFVVLRPRAQTGKDAEGR